MAKFQYTARTQEGKLESDIIEAPSVEAAISVLQNQQLIIIDIKPFSEAENLAFNKLVDQLLSYFNRVKNEEIALFTKQLRF